jgi:phosphoesterase RecJ-like protein
MESNQATAEDLDGLVNLTRDIEGVVVGALFRELEGEQTKVSLRSKSGFNSSACLNPFGGGGHAGAAGAAVDMPLEKCRKSVLAAVQSQLSEMN